MTMRHLTKNPLLCAKKKELTTQLKTDLLCLHFKSQEILLQQVLYEKQQFAKFKQKKL